MVAGPLVRRRRAFGLDAEEDSWSRTRIQEPCDNAKGSAALERAIRVHDSDPEPPHRLQTRALDQVFQVLARRFFETAQSVSEGKRVLRAEQRHRPGRVVPETDELSLLAHLACSV